jgi:hypothetical protein
MITMSVHRQSKTGIGELIEAHREHLRQLEVKSARMGAEVPVHILTEINRYRTEIGELQNVEVVAPSEENCATLGTIGMYQLLYAHIMRLDGDIWKLSERTERLNTQIEALLMTLAQAYLTGAQKPQGEG